MTVIPFAAAGARGLRRVASAVHVWTAARTLNLARRTPKQPDALRMPPCVWYGRSVFCFHVPSETSPAGEREH